MDKKILERIRSSKNAADFKKLANENGYNLTDAQASKYFDMFHTAGEVNETELDNVAGGSCGGGEWSRNGRTYSSDAPHDLIVTAGNDCPSFKYEPGKEGCAEQCMNCYHMYKPTGFTMYCGCRTFDNDPYNPK